MSEESELGQKINVIEKVVASEFFVEESFLYQGIPVVRVKVTPDFGQAFERLVKKLKPMNLVPILMKGDGEAEIRIVPSIREKRRDNILVNIVLFLATVATVFFAGYYITLDFLEKAWKYGGIHYPLDPFGGAAMYTCTLMAVLGLHEFAHKLAARKHDVEATLPYFIPGPPPLGTFGALIMQKSYPPNRDALFDIGASGPIAGFLVSLAVSIIGLPLSPVVPPSPDMRVAFPPLILQIVLLFMPRATQGSAIILLHPVAFAGYIGMLVTMLNLLPVGTLDGGHIARSVLGERGRTILLIMSVVLLLILGYWAMLILVLFFSMYRHPGPLDDVSELSKGRKLIAGIVFVIFILTMPLSPLLF